MPSNTKEILIKMETAALERWGKGDPSGYLEILAPDFDYFDPSLEHRMDGYQAISEYYEALRGKIHVEHFELIDPSVRECGDIAVLTFNYVSRQADGSTQRWNCTEIYRRDSGQFRLIHSHWSFTCAVK